MSQFLYILGILSLLTYQYHHYFSIFISYIKSAFKRQQNTDTNMLEIYNIRYKIKKG